MSLSFNYFHRKNRVIKDINILFFFLPLVLLPLLLEWWLHAQDMPIFSDYKHEILLTNIAYIARFVLLNTVVYNLSFFEYL